MGLLLLTTKERVKARIQPKTPTKLDDYDTWFEDTIRQLSIAMAGRMRRELLAGTYTDQFVPNGERFKYWIKAYPATAVSEIRINGIILETTVDSPTYLLRPNGRLVEFRTAPRRTAMGLLEIDYTGGIAADPAALLATDKWGDLSMACERQVQAFWRTKDMLGSVTTHTAGGSSVTVENPDKWLRDVREIVKRHTRKIRA